MKSSHRAIRVAPRFTEDQQAVFTKKHRLPLTTALSTYVQLFDTDSGYALCLYEKRDDVECRFRADLNKAHVVNNTTEKGPCLFLMCENGHFEFQTDGNSMFKFWLGVFTVCGVSLIRFTDLYKQQQCIGEGTFAKVYSGRHRYTHQEVCIKEIAKAGNQSSSVYTEIGILRKVVHPYINRLHAAYEIEDKIYLVLEYLRGGELFSFLNENGPYIEAHAKVAIRRILVALECLHSQGIVHRDLKNENLILETKDDPTKLKIIDFGLASTLDSPAMKQRCGSPGYAAPEILDHQRYGVKVDLFSAGVILYTVLSGSPPFGGSTISQVIKSNSRAKISFQHHRWKSVSQSAKDLITWMTARNPDLRCSALQALTHPWFEGVPSSISTTAPKTSIRTLEAVAASKKTAVPEVGSASTCASAQGANTPFGTDSTSSSATQRSPHVRPVAGVPGVRNQPIVTTTTVRVVSSGVPTSPLGARGEASTITRPAALPRIPVPVGAPVAMWTPGSKTAFTAESSAYSPVYRRVQSRPFDAQNRPLLPPSEGHSPVYNRTRMRAKTGAWSRNAESDMVKNAARALPAAQVDDRPRPQVQAKSVAIIAPPTTWRTRSMHCDVEGDWGMARVGSAKTGAWSKGLKSRNGPELDAVLSKFTASNPALQVPGQTYVVSSNYYRACRFGLTPSPVAPYSPLPSARIVHHADPRGVDTSQYAARLRKSPTGINKTVRFGIEDTTHDHQKTVSGGEMPPELRRFKSMPANPDPETGTTKERSPIVTDHDINHRSGVHRGGRSGEGFNPLIISTPVVRYEQQPKQVVAFAAPATTTPPAESRLPLPAKTTTYTKPHSPIADFFRRATGRPRNYIVDKMSVGTAPSDIEAKRRVVKENHKGKVTVQPAPAPSPIATTTSRKWRGATLKL